MTPALRRFLDSSQCSSAISVKKCASCIHGVETVAYLNCQSGTNLLFHEESVNRFVKPAGGRHSEQSDENCYQWTK